MFTICIPIYNYDCSRLVNDLHQQALATDLAFQILLMDDASDEAYRKIHSDIKLEHVDYIQLSTNVGRSKIRNLLAEKADYPYLIFMDCDSEVPTSSYIQNYIPYFTSEVVCYGGRSYKEVNQNPKEILRWKYGTEREALSAEQRNKNANYGFETNNFLISKSLFEQVKFNENLTTYGHEDTLFGLELQAKEIKIIHIDNPLIHIGLEDANSFLSKTKNSVKNLLFIDKIIEKNYPNINYSSLIRTGKKLKKWRLAPFYRYFFHLFKSTWHRNLLSPNPSLFYFDLYRLGLLLDIVEKQ